MRLLALAVLLAPALAGPARPDPDLVREGLLAPGREARERARAEVREWARTDPAGAAGLWEGLDLRGRVLLTRALASAGTRHAAQVAIARAGRAPEPEIFHALLQGLPEGGARALGAPLPEELPPDRRAAIESLRFRWRVEEEFVRLKSPSGPTGHYKGQFKGLRALGPCVIPLLLDIVRDRAHPLPGDGAAGTYSHLHPELARFDPFEMRQLAAYAFGEVVEPDDAKTIAELERLFEHYWELEGERFRWEREELAPVLSYSLHDLGRGRYADQYIAKLLRLASVRSVRGLSYLWELGYAYMRIGRYEQGKACYERVLEHSVSRALAAYNLACSYAIRASEDPENAEAFKAQALDYLRRAIYEFNYGDWVWMEEDGDLDSIKDEPGYKRLLEFLQRKYPARKRGKVSKKIEDFLGPK